MPRIESAHRGLERNGMSFEHDPDEIFPLKKQSAFARKREHPVRRRS